MKTNAIKTLIRLSLLFTAALGCFGASACDPAAATEELPTPPSQPDTPNDQENENTENDESDNTMEQTTLTFTVDGRSFTATLVDNSSTRALITHLSEGAIRLRMDDYGGMEKVGSLGFSLPRNDARISTGPGDVILYQGNSLVFYYGTNQWSLTRLGKVDGVTTREQMLDLLGGTGAVTVTVSLGETH